jgi:hypothetical protein
MSRLRFSVAELMALVLWIGYGFAALRNANDVRAGATFGLAIVAASVGLAGACFRKEGARMPWAGFGIAGGLRLVVWSLAPTAFGNVRGAPYFMFYQLHTQISHFLDVLLLGLLAAVLCDVLAAKDDTSNP